MKATIHVNFKIQYDPVFLFFEVLWAKMRFLPKTPEKGPFWGLFSTLTWNNSKTKKDIKISKTVSRTSEHGLSNGIWDSEIGHYLPDNLANQKKNLKIPQLAPYPNPLYQLCARAPDVTQKYRACAQHSKRVSLLSLSGHRPTSRLFGRGRWRFRDWPLDATDCFRGGYLSWFLKNETKLSEEEWRKEICKI